MTDNVPDESAAGIVPDEKTVHLGAWLPYSFRKSLRLAQAETDRPITELIAEALNMLFEKYNVPVVERHRP